MVVSERWYRPSSPWWFLVRGVAHLLRTPSLWKLVVRPVAATALVSIVVHALLLGFAFPAQSRGLERAGLGRAVAWFLGFFITLTEGFFVTTTAFVTVFGQLDQEVFDKVYEARALEEACEHLAKAPDPPCCPPCRGYGWFGALQFALGFVTLPLNVVPVVGNVAWAGINGLPLAWGLHREYMSRHGVESAKEELDIATSKLFYSRFGSIAALSILAPVVGPFFLLASAAGAALYAAEEEPALRYLHEHGKWDGPLGAPPQSEPAT